MKKLFTLLVLLATTIGAMAQLNGKWENTRTGHKSRTVINAKLQIKNPNGEVLTNVYQGNYTIAAFVGEAGQEECRLVTLDNAENVLVQPDASDVSSKLLMLQVPGNYTNDEDNGKPITFMVKVNGYIYKLNASQPITFRDEGNAYGTPASTNPVILSMQMISHITIAAFNVGVDESINLREQLDVAPSTASKPMNAFKISDQYSEYATLTGDVLTGVKPVNNAILYLVNNDTGGNVTSIYFNVIKHATSVELLKTSLTVDLNDDETLTKFMTDNVNTYKLQPEGSNDKVRWEITDLNGQEDYNSITYYDTHEFPWKPTEAGTVRIRPYVLVNNNKLVPANNAWVTVNIVVPITKAYLKWDSDVIDVKCNKGDDFYQRFLARVKIEPAEADQTFTIELEKSSDSQYLKIDNDKKSLVALARNKGLNVWVIPNGYGGYEYKFLVPVSIEDEAQNISYIKSTLYLDSKMTPAEAFNAIIANVTWLPEGSIPYGEGIKITSTGWLDAKVTVNDAGNTVIEDGDLTLTMSEGTHQVHAQMHKKTYNLYYGGSGQISDTQMDIYFTVNITSLLDHFEITVTPNEDDQTKGIITLTPKPDGCTYSLHDYTVSFSSPQAYIDANWDDDSHQLLYITSSQWPTENFNYTAYLPGRYGVSIKKDEDTSDHNYGSKQFDVPAAISFSDGWQWKSNPYGKVIGADLQTVQNQLNGDQNLTPVNSNTLKRYLTDEVVEARTYSKLLINDPSWGFYGSLLASGIAKQEMHKVKMGGEQKSFYYMSDAAASIDSENALELQPGWNWVGSPYLYDRTLAQAVPLSNTGLVKKMVIVSKSDGSVEYDGTKWSGNLKNIKAGQGYLVYNPATAAKQLVLPSEYGFGKGSASTRSLSRAGSVGVWQYDHTQYADNMTMVVVIPDLQDAENYTIGAFVDGECRGEGVFEDGFGFITVHCNNGEVVSFQLHNELTDDFYDIDQTVISQMRVGSLDAPLKLTYRQSTYTGIGTINNTVGASRYYDLNGRLLNSQRKGVSILRKADGTVRKVVISK